MKHEWGNAFRQPREVKRLYIDVLMSCFSTYSALPLELLQSCTKLSICDPLQNQIHAVCDFPIPSFCVKSTFSLLTHWDRVTHICVGNLTTIGSDNGLSPAPRQAIISTNAGILSIGPLGTNFNEISIRIQTFSFKKMHFKMSSAKWRPFCLGLNVLTYPMVKSYRVEHKHHNATGDKSCQRTIV